MKKVIYLLSTLFFTLVIWAQSPNQLSYQAVLRDHSNLLLTDQEVNIKISILTDKTVDLAVYTEQHLVRTNTNGLVTLEIGQGTNSTGAFSEIDWSAGTYFIKSEIDIEGGTNFSTIGTTQCQSVPYALFANATDTIIGDISLSQISDLDQLSTYTGNGVINAMNYGVKGDGTTDDTEAIATLLETANGQRVFFPAGEYIVNDTVFKTDNVNIDGIYPRYINGSLVDGTIFRGAMSFIGTNVRITNIGVDLSGLEGEDGLRVSGLELVEGSVGTPELNKGLFCDIHNIITVGANKTSEKHSFRIEAFDHVNISNIEVRDAYMGVVLKVQGGIVSNLRAYEITKEAVFIKSDNVYGYCMDLIIDKIYVENTSAPNSTGIKIQSAGAQLENVNVSNVFIRRTQLGLVLQSARNTGVRTNNINISNVKIDYPALYGIYLEADDGSVDNINISNVDVTHATNILTTQGEISYFNLTGLNANVLNTATVEQKEKIIEIRAGTKGTKLTNITILNDHDVDPSLAIYYANEGVENRISNYNVRLRGATPESGFNADTLEIGVKNSLQPVFNDIENQSIISVISDVENAVIDTISIYPNSDYPTNPFHMGYELLIQNKSDVNFIINHNPDGHIENPGDANVTVNPHTFITYIFNGEYWDREE